MSRALMGACDLLLIDTTVKISLYGQTVKEETNI